jgi:hypothetical protein
MATVGFATLQIIPSLRGASASINSQLATVNTTQAGGKVGSSFAAGFKRVAGPLLAVAGAAAITDFTGDAIKAGSDVAESTNKNRVVFGEASQAVLDFAANAATGLGQSKAQALEATGVFGNLLRSAGLNESRSADLSTSLTTLASDMASFNNTSVDEALVALRSGLVGETEPLKRFGVNLNEAVLKQKALELGLSDGKSVLDANAKAQAAYALITEQTTLAQGDFARTSDGLANKQKILSAQFEDVKARLGTALLPVATKVVDFLSDNMPAAIETISNVTSEVSAVVQEHWPQIEAGIVGAVRTIESIVGPIVGGIEALWANFGDNILAFVERVWPFVAQRIEGTLNIIRGVIQVVTSLIQGDWSAVWEGIKLIVSGAWDAVVGIIGTAIETVKFIIGVGLEVVTGMFSGVWDSIVETVTGLPGRLAEAGAGMWDWLKEAFEGVINAIIGGWNDFELKLPSFEGFSVAGREIIPGWEGPTLGMPHIDPIDLAGGALVMRRPGGVLSRVGEGRFHEAVLPLSAETFAGIARPIAAELAGAGGTALVGGDLVVQQLPGEDAGQAALRALRKIRLMAAA